MEKLSPILHVQSFIDDDHHHNYGKHEDQWLRMVDHEDTNNLIPSSSSDLSTEYPSSLSHGSTSSSEVMDDNDDDASSHLNSPLYQLSELMSQLPIKRGLSKFFQGKSQSFTSISSVKSIGDLAKKESGYSNYKNRRKFLKACKSYGGGLDAHKSHTLPKPTISKKVVSRATFSSFTRGRRSNNFFINTPNRPPPIPLHKNF